MANSVIIEGVSRKEFLDFAERVLSILTHKVQRTEYTINELSEMTGYSKSHLRLLIKQSNVPYSRRGRDIVVAREFVGYIKTKGGKSVGL